MPNEIDMRQEPLQKIPNLQASAAPDENKTGVIMSDHQRFFP